MSTKIEGLKEERSKLTDGNQREVESLLNAIRDLEGEVTKLKDEAQQDRLLSHISSVVIDEDHLQSRRPKIHHQAINHEVEDSVELDRLSEITPSSRVQQPMHNQSIQIRSKRLSAGPPS